ncbi:hypothetical protein HDV06_001367 [Boothiomyces sp. JEL0866]|nr:hypothetical protein HDV06_001367 [Boothiomyces sp. JEL0866]
MSINLLSIDSKFKKFTEQDFVEKINMKTLSNFRNAKWRKNNNIEFDSKVITLINKYFKSFAENSSETVVKYNYSENLCGIEQGRVYGFGLQTLKKEIRNAIVQDICFDIDIKNAHPCFIYNLGKLYNIDLPTINKYVENRDTVLESLMEQLKKSKGEVKEIFLAVLNGSNKTLNNDLLINLEFESKKIYNHFKDIYPELEQYVNKKKQNECGSFVSLLNTIIESNIMRIVVHSLQEQGVKVNTIIHDGCLIEKASVVGDLDEILLKCNQDVKEHYYGFEIELLVKNFNVPEYNNTLDKEVNITESQISDYFLDYSKTLNEHYLIDIHDVLYCCNEDSKFLWDESGDTKLHLSLINEDFINYCKSRLEPNTTFDFHKKLQNHTGMNNVTKFINKKIKVDKKFKFNPNKNILSFKNGVYDLSQDTFRERLPEDYLTIEIDYNFTRTTDYQKQLDLVYSMFEDNDTRDYILKILATCIIGKRVFEEFFVFSGVGRNGKSTIENIMKKSLGPYANSMNPNFFCEKAVSSACALPEIDSCKYKRGLFMAEPDEKSTFNSGKIKQFTGKEITTRTIFEKPEAWEILFTIVFSCNNIPKFDDTTFAFKRRVRIIRFPFRFEYEPILENDRKRVDFEFDDSFYNGFINLLIDYNIKYVLNCKSESLNPIPQKVSEFTNNYFDDNDYLGSYIKEVFEITINNKDKLSRKDIYSTLQMHTSTSNFTYGQKTVYDYLRTSLQLEEYMSRGNRGFRRIKLKETVTSNEDDDDESVEEGSM